MKNKCYATLTALSLYAQVEVVDVESCGDIPEWVTGYETMIYGNHGVRIATKPDSDIEIVVSNYQVMEDPILCNSGNIRIGNKGLLVGNIPASTTTHINIPAGVYRLVILTNGLGSEVTRVNIVIRTDIKSVEE